MAVTGQTEATAATTTAAASKPAAAATPAKGSGDTGLTSSQPPSRPPPTPLERVRISCLMNAHYHEAREAALDSRHRWLMFFVILFGTATVVDLAKLSHLITWVVPLLGAAIAAMAALDLTLDFSNRARVHALMKRRYFELLADVTEGRRTTTEAEACLIRYSADEEPAFDALIKSAWNAAQETVYGDDAHGYLIPRHVLWLKNLRRFQGRIYKMRPVREKKAKSAS